MATFSIINSSNFPIWLFSEWKLEITVSINYNQVHFSSTPFYPNSFSHSKKSFQCMSFEMWHINPGCWWELLSACWALAGSRWALRSSRSVLRWRGSGEPLWLSRAGNVRRIGFLVKFLALPASSLTRATSRKALCNICLRGSDWIAEGLIKEAKQERWDVDHTVPRVFTLSTQTSNLFPYIFSFIPSSPTPGPISSQRFFLKVSLWNISPLHLCS